MSLMKKKMGCCLFLLFMASIVMAEVKVTNVSVKPRWPWNGLVDITYSIECDEVDDEGKPKDVYVTFEGHDIVRNQKIAMKTLTGDGAKDAVKNGGPYTLTWNAAKDSPNINSAAFKVDIHAMTGLAPYMVVDLSGGPNANSYPVRYTASQPDLNDDTCRTTELWLRWIPAGAFMMGSPTNELGRDSDEVQHSVTITKIYYIGVFECTQKQWQLIMGSNPSAYKGDCRPVDSVSYNMIRGTGTKAGAGWPTYGHTVDATSFMGKLQAKTGQLFDLPTEAQWEYACRAGTTTALNSGKNLTSSTICPNVNEVARYRYNQNDGKGGYSNAHTKVGSYLPNAWGLYDMHGNVWEGMLDWMGNYGTGAIENPVGASSGSKRVTRSGSWKDSDDGIAEVCRSAERGALEPSICWDQNGFRIVCLPFEQ